MSMMKGNERKGSIMNILVVVDMQNDFIDGALGTPEAQAIVENVRRKIEQYRQEGGQVVFTRDTHTAEYMDTREGKNLPVPHCIKGTPGWEISSVLNTAGSEIVDKPTFGSLTLAEMLHTKKNVASVELVGLCTDICVISNAMILKARLPETDIIVDSSCCAGVTPESHRNALEAMKMCQITVR